MARNSSLAVEVVGLPAFRKQLRQLENPRRWTTELGRVHRDLAKDVASAARGAASGMGGPQRKFAGAIVGRGGASGARIGLRGNDANAAFWGAKQRTGWNAGTETPNLPKWVGNSWEVGAAGQGPYAINATIAARMDEILEQYGDAIDRLWGEATTYTSTTF
jgi:hypothetical protein